MGDEEDIGTPIEEEEVAPKSVDEETEKRRKEVNREINKSKMKSPKVQNPRRILLHALRASSLCQCACTEIGHASRCSCYVWCCQFSFQQASFWARLTIVGQAGYSPAVLQA